MCFLKKREGEREEEEEGRGALTSPLKQILFISAPVIYKIFGKTLVLYGGTNTLLDKCILFRSLIGTLCQKP
jgi:hypothetical protein